MCQYFFHLFHSLINRQFKQKWWQESGPFITLVISFWKYFEDVSTKHTVKSETITKGKFTVVQGDGRGRLERSSAAVNNYFKASAERIVFYIL